MWAIVSAVALIGLASLAGVVGVALAASLVALFVASKLVDDGMSYRTRLAVMGGAFLLPLTAVRWAESSSIIALAVILLVAATMFVLKGLKEGAVVSFSHLMIGVLTTGYLLSYLPLIRALEDGKDMMWSFLLAMSGLYLAKRMLISRLPTRLQGWVAPVAGVAASGLLAAVSLLFLPDTVSLVSMLILGVTVGGAGLVGESSERMFSNQAPDVERIWRGLGPLLFAAPAFFYAFRLYLT